MNTYQNSFDGNIPQDVTARPGENAIFIVYSLKHSADTFEKVKDVCANFSAMIRSMRNRFPDMQFSCTIGFGADAWSQLFPKKAKPKELSTFKEIKGDKYTAVSTPGDILLHIRARQMGLCFEFASIIDEKLKGVVESVDETHGFRYMDGKAIIGFVDGTESPAVDENPYYFAAIGNEDPDFAGGSYVFVQKYIHDMVAWNALPVEAQEKVIGRHKFNDVELSDEEKPENAHNAVTNIENSTCQYAICQYLKRRIRNLLYRLRQYVQYYQEDAGKHVYRQSCWQHRPPVGFQYTGNRDTLFCSLIRSTFRTWRVIIPSLLILE